MASKKQAGKIGALRRKGVGPQVARKIAGVKPKSTGGKRKR